MSSRRAVCVCITLLLLPTACWLVAAVARCPPLPRSTAPLSLPLRLPRVRPRRCDLTCALFGRRETFRRQSKNMSQVIDLGSRVSSSIPDYAFKVTLRAAAAALIRAL